MGYLPLEKMKEPLIYKGSWSGRNRTRTCDPIDVNDVLYQLSHATIYVIRFLGLWSMSHPWTPNASVKRSFRIPKNSIVAIST